jgi:hypothetical protein
MVFLAKRFNWNTPGTSGAPNFYTRNSSSATNFFAEVAPEVVH